MYVKMAVKWGSFRAIYSPTCTFNVLVVSINVLSKDCAVQFVDFPVKISLYLFIFI